MQMKPADKKLFESLQRETTLLHAYWKVYKQLFTKKEERVRLLNASGSLVFHILQHLLLSEVTLSLGRLTDSPETHGKANHSIPRLLKRVDGRRLPELKRNLDDKWSVLKDKCKPFRTRRNKLVAHADLAQKLRYAKEPVPGVSQQSVEAALFALRDVLNVYDHHFRYNTTMYEDVTISLGTDAEFLVSLLKRAHMFKVLEKNGKLDRTLAKEGEYADA